LKTAGFTVKEAIYFGVRIFKKKKPDQTARL
jgi:hypothetical protein